MTNQSFTQNLIAGIKKKIRRSLNNPYKSVNINWLKLKYYKHLSPGKVRSHSLFKRQLFFYSPTELLHGLREIFIENIYSISLNSQPFILDCGANIGLSVLYFKRAHPNSIVIAFEPDERNFDLLSRNISSFGISGVELRKEAIWKENTTLNFSNEGSMGSKIEQNNLMKTKEVKAVRLKEFINQKVDFLKIDIEGAEYDVLVDIAPQLHLVQNMFLEYHGVFDQNNELVEIFNIVKNAGFKFYIKEAASIYESPFQRNPNPYTSYDIQLNIFCFRN